MRTLVLRELSMFAGVLCISCSVIGQVPACQVGLSFPNPAIDRDPAIFNTAADLKLAVSADKILLVSNDKFQLRCRTTGGKTTGTPTVTMRLLPRLFQPFVSTRLDARGTGLGLAVAEGIVREHGGLVLARNRTDGAGSSSGAVFEVMLPARGEGSA